MRTDTLSRAGTDTDPGKGQGGICIHETQNAYVQNADNAPQSLLPLVALLLSRIALLLSLFALYSILHAALILYTISFRTLSYAALHTVCMLTYIALCAILHSIQYTPTYHTE